MQKQLNNKDPPVKKKLAGQIGSFRSSNYKMVPFLEGKSENWFAPFNQV